MMNVIENAQMTRKKSGKAVSGKGMKLFVVDGTALCYRAFYAIARLSTSKGEPTNAIYGFLTMMEKFVDQWKPDYLAICFDSKEPTFRHEEYEDYKANREAPPDDLIGQFEPIKDFCRALNYAVFEKPGFEADDLFGTLADKGESEGFDVYVVTGDKDAFQLVTERVKILNPHKEVVFDTEAVKERFSGLGPEKVIDIMALMGDSSDNIPGVPGIGEKTAIKLIQEFGSLENLLKYSTKVKSKSQQTKLAENKDSAVLSKRLATIDKDVAMKIDWDEIKRKEPNAEELFDLCKRYEFKRFIKDYAPQGEADQSERDYRIVQTEKELSSLVKALEKAKAVSFDTETTSSDPVKADLVGFSFSYKPFLAFYVPVSSKQHDGPGLPIEKVVAAFKPILENQKIEKYGQNVKYDTMVLSRYDIHVQGVSFDTMIASYLINPVKFNHSLDDISLEYLSVKKITTESLIGKGKSQITMDQVPLEDISRYAAEDADCVFRLVPILRKRLEENKLMDLFNDVEMPLSEVLGQIETNGVLLDLKFLKKLSENAGKDLEELTKAIYKEAGQEFNINSTKQLSDILFVQMKLPVIKKTKTGFSTDVNVLQKLALSYELPKKILEYREKAKLKSTYLDALPEIVNEKTGLVHTSYHQTVTATGRLSSASPNLQNIPIKTEEGRLVRRAFVPRFAKSEKGQLISADYSQIELRLLAHLSGDKNLLKAFKEDRDIHKFTATLLYDVDEEDVNREMRNVAKTINFSIIYGKTAYGLSQDLNISIQEADQFIQDYFKRYKTIREYLDSQKEKAKEQGYLTTLLGRRSYFPDINSSNGQVRQFAERAAINAPIQGSAADVIKLAMINIQKRLEDEGLKSLMIMQVHDELVFDVTAKEKDRVSELVREEMEGAYGLKVPLSVDLFVGDSWYKD